MATSIWNSAVARCNIPSPRNTQEIIIARLRRVPKKGGVIDMLKFSLSGTTLKVTCERHYTTIPFKRLSEETMTHSWQSWIPSGNHQRAIALMLSDLSMLTVKSRSNNLITFTTSDTAVLPSILHPYMQQSALNHNLNSLATISNQLVVYASWFVSNTSFSTLSPAKINSLLGQILSTLSEDGWYLNCEGRRMSLTTSANSLKTLAEHKLLRHGRRRDQDKWDDLIHARSSDSSSGSSSGSSSESESDSN
jgi:hypothetical protein